MLARKFSIEAFADASPNAPALWTDGVFLGATEVALRVRRARGWLHRQGALAGGRAVAFAPAATPNTLFILLALFEDGIPVVPLHPKLSESERRQQLAALDLPHTWLDLPEAVISEAPLAPPPDTPPEEALLVLLHTSGSAGRPKAVRLTRRALLCNAESTWQHLGLEENDSWLLSLSPAHIGGLAILTRCLVARRPVVLPLQGSLTAGVLLETLERSRATLCSLVPTQLQRCLDSTLLPPPHLRGVLLGGARAPAALVARAKEARWPVLTTYGSTETASQVVTQPYAERFSMGAGVGITLPGVRATVATDGRLRIQGPTLFSGYSGEGFAAQEDWQTQDLARIDSDGRIHILGRADTVIITGGENVRPEEVEAAILACPGVDAALVVGIPDPDWGERVCAGITGSVQLEVVISWCQAQLAPFKVPKELRLLEALPLLPNQKPDRRALAELFASVPPPPLPRASEGS